MIGYFDKQTRFGSLGRSIILSLDGMALVIGAASNNSNGVNSGTLRVYGRIKDDSWLQIGNGLEGRFDGDYYGEAIIFYADSMIVAFGTFLNNEDTDYMSKVMVYTFCKKLYK